MNIISISLGLNSFSDLAYTDVKLYIQICFSVITDYDFLARNNKLILSATNIVEFVSTTALNQKLHTLRLGINKPINHAIVHLLTDTVK